MGQASSSATVQDGACSLDADLKDFKKKSQILSQETITLIQSQLEAGNLQEAVAAVSDHLRDIEKAPLNVAIIGETGAGKSSLINALLGLDPEEECAAATGVIGTTIERTPYLHPKFPSVTLWDLPGTGVMLLQDYLKKIKFEEYDFFIAVSSTRFKQNDEYLLKAIAKTKRSFYFVQTKIDCDVRYQKVATPKRFVKENVLRQIRNRISSTLQDLLGQTPPIFLVSNFDVSDYDFPELETALLRELPAYKRHVFLLTLPTITDTIIDQKKDSLKGRIWSDSLKASWYTLPSMHLTKNNMKNLEENLNFYRSQFGLDDASLENIAKHLHMPVEELKAHIQSPHLFTAETHESLAEKLLARIQPTYFSKTFCLQNHFVDTVANDVKILLSKEEILTEKDDLRYTDMDPTCPSELSPSQAQSLASSIRTFFKTFKKENKILSKETITLIEKYLENKNLKEACSTISRALKDIDKAPLNIAVLGESGAGKSSFINALRGVGNEEEGAAATGVVETTMKRTAYPHPKFPNVIMWDVPGIGSMNFPPQNYLKEIRFEDYDFFIIISATRFKENDAKLARAVAKMKMNLYFVRTKIDSDINNEQRGKPKRFNKESVLTKIRDDCSKRLREVLSDEPQVFLISNFDVSDYDFPKLESTLLRELPAHKRHVFMLSLHNVTEAAIDRKKDVLKQKLWLEALKEGAWATLPCGGLIRDNLENLRATLSVYRSYFGLDDASLDGIAKDVHVSVNQLKEHLESPRLLTEDKDVLLEEKLLNYITRVCSVIGGPLAGGLYFRKTYYVYSHFIDTVANDAKVLLNKEELFREEVGTTEYWEMPTQQ